MYKKYINDENKINKIINNYNECINNIDLDIDLNAVDGICSNEIKNNTLFTNQNLYFLDMKLNIPLDFTDNNNICIFDNNKNNKSNKNNESVVFNKYTDYVNKTKNKIYVNRA